MVLAYALEALMGMLDHHNLTALTAADTTEPSGEP
ncbi:predicted protein [Streptomyces filamentosus NRRL 15998]|uniref:Predicted protein n=1 Tax=Streptomyces filamentosus NRRL 15998 TaxID=457431 RepID=D6ARM6_STRFL|nr:predicted protein [Streptomyces filamentosus NRRL 15998]